MIILFLFFMYFQALLAVRAKVMPHQALSKNKAIVLLCSGWLYGFCIVVLYMLMPHKYEGYDCATMFALIHKIPMTIYALSVLFLSALIIILQAATYWRLWKQQQMAVGSVIANTGRNRLYRRAMITSSLIAICFLIGWVPFSITFLRFHWSNIDRKTLNTTIWSLGTLAVLQSFSNPLIFKLRNSNMEFRVWKRCLN